MNLVLRSEPCRLIIECRGSHKHAARQLACRHDSKKLAQSLGADLLAPLLALHDIYDLRLIIRRIKLDVDAAIRTAALRRGMKAAYTKVFRTHFLKTFPVDRAQQIKAQSVGRRRYR